MGVHRASCIVHRTCGWVNEVELAATQHLLNGCPQALALLMRGGSNRIKQASEGTLNAKRPFNGMVDEQQGWGFVDGGVDGQITKKRKVIFFGRVLSLGLLGPLHARCTPMGLHRARGARPPNEIDLTTIRPKLNGPCCRAAKANVADVCQLLP